MRAQTEYKMNPVEMIINMLGISYELRVATSVVIVSALIKALI